MVTQNLENQRFSLIFVYSSYVSLHAFLGPKLSEMKPTWKQVEPHLVCLGADFAHIGVNLGVLVAVLPPTWPVLGPDWHQLRPTWASLEPTWGELEPTWSPPCQHGVFWIRFGSIGMVFGSVLGRFGCVLGRFGMYFRSVLVANGTGNVVGRQAGCQ